MKLSLCEKCGKIMKISKDKAVCSCGFERAIKDEEKKSSEKMAKKESHGIIVKDIINESASFPHKCSKCGYDKAEVIMSEPWYSDADQNFRYKCGKCGHVERERLVKT